MLWVRLMRSSASGEGPASGSASNSFGETDSSSSGELDTWEPEPSGPGSDQLQEEGVEQHHGAPIKARLRKLESDEGASGDGEYLDDLQDAAAGLARLMHCSESSQANVREAPADNDEELDSQMAECLSPKEGEAPSENVPETQVILIGEVAEQIGRIDTELDALEALVSSIEDSLEAFSGLEEEEESPDDASGEPKDGSIADAA